MDILTLKTTEDYNKLLGENENVIIKFSATWCGPCRTMTNIIHNLNDEALNNVIFGEIDVDEEDFSDVLTDNNIKNLPTFIFFKNNEAKAKKVGLIQTNEMIDFVKDNL